MTPWCCGVQICWYEVPFGTHNVVVGMAVTWVIDDSGDMMEGGDLVFGSCKSWWCLMMVMVDTL